jgi:hypothetical protein
VSVDGTIAGEASVGTYQSFAESIVRKAVAAQATLTSAAGDVDTVAGTGPSGTITCTAANFLTSGFRTGMVIRATGFVVGAANNSTNLLITSMISTGKSMSVVRLDGVTFANGTETTATPVLTEVGKHTFIPATGQTRDYYTIEHFFGDINQSEAFTDCVISQLDVKLPATGMAGMDWQVMGIDMSPSTSQQQTSPTAPSTGRNLAAANGVVYLAGSAVALITGLNFSVKGGHTKIGGVVGANTEPDIFPGTVTCDGQATVLFKDATVRDYFLNETEVTLVCVFTTDNTATAGFMGFTFPRVKMGGASKDDGEKVL